MTEPSGRSRRSSRSPRRGSARGRRDLDREADLSESARQVLARIALRAEAARRLELGAGEAVLRSIVDATVRLFEAEAASLALFDPALNRLVFRVAAGEQGSGVVGLSIAPDQGLVGYVYSTGQALALSDVRNDARFGRAFAEQTQYVPRSIVAVPLVDEQGVLGVLEVLDKRSSEAFSLRDIELASVFAGQAAVAIRASRVERDTTQILRSALGTLSADASAETGATDAEGAQTDGATAAALDELVGDAMRALGTDDATGLWRLVEAIARARRAEPEQLDLVADLLAVLADHAERRRTGRTDRARRYAGRTRGTSSATD